MLSIAHQEPSVLITDLLWNLVSHTHTHTRTKMFQSKELKEINPLNYSCSATMIQSSVAPTMFTVSSISILGFHTHAYYLQMLSILHHFSWCGSRGPENKQRQPRCLSPQPTPPASPGASQVSRWASWIYNVPNKCVRRHPSQMPKLSQLVPFKRKRFFSELLTSSLTVKKCSPPIIFYCVKCESHCKTHCVVAGDDVKKKN